MLEFYAEETKRNVDYFLVTLKGAKCDAKKYKSESDIEVFSLRQFLNFVFRLHWDEKIETFRNSLFSEVYKTR